ncbi:5-exo-hydroxycamphor dehydrogenase [Pseudoalteromonas sp. P1-9]|uniref:zinc-binding dehydrogenase n=1 Tax=Pseudoalteromonas sp. P1-9 TaxID=1710354 RepID=UPI0006D60F0B|nr:zinc-binding dehydrogenase [Pseudoalteromonas sp. P1-9]KPV93681.1 5-exo-hydroxycamphor dehydrogenase [Pseudoalteromonas sp. P1-9]
MIKAYTLNGDGQPPVKVEIDTPTLSKGELLVETLYSEVCGTDLHLQSGSMKGVSYPVIPGHFFVGRVVEMSGPKKDIDGNPISIGDVLTFMDVHGTCGICWNCTTGEIANKCGERQVYGVTHSVIEGPMGGWSEKILIKKDVLCAKLPSTLPPERYIIAGCALPTALHGIERANVRLHENVLVQGAGPVGINLAILSRACGAKRVVIADKSELRLEKATALGFEGIIVGSPNKNDMESAKQLTNGRGFDIVFEATGSPHAIADGFNMARDGGKYIVVGQYSDNGETQINPHNHINRKHVTVKGVWGIELRHFRQMIDVLSITTNTLDPKVWDSLDVSYYPLDEVTVALQKVKDGEVTKAVIKVNS